MGKYLKLFDTHADYNTYITGSDKVLPNVSYCVDNNEVHYNPWTDPRLIITYNVEDTSEPTLLYHYIIDSWYDVETGQTVEVETIGVNLFEKIEIDGVEASISDLDSDEGYYQFNTTGNHIVKYTLLDPTTLGDDGTFSECGNITSVIIPNTVTTIGSAAFYGCTGLTSVTIPNGITSIASSAFADCTSLTSITIPNTVTTIGYAAFYGCTSLTSITIPNTVTTIGSAAFWKCTSLTSVTIPDSVTSIGNAAFYGCTSLTSVTIGNGVTIIDITAFSRCTSLTSVAIPNSVTSIGNAAFQHCSGLTSVTIGNSVTTIGTYAFDSCSGLTNITSLATTAPTIIFSTFQNIKTGGTLTVPLGSTGYDTWMSTGNYYLGKYGWTKVEQ